MRISSINTISLYKQNKFKTNYHSFGNKSNKNDEKFQRLYSVMSEIKSKNQQITRNELSEITGMSLPTLSIRINKNSQLQNLYNEIKKPAAKKAVPKTIKSEQKDAEIKQQKEQIKAILKNAQEKQEKLSLRQIAELTGLSQTIIQSRIIYDDELHEIFRQIMLFKVNKYSEEEQEKQKDQIWQALLKAKTTKSYIGLDEIGKILGISSITVLKRIKSDEELNIFWQDISSTNRSIRQKERRNNKSQIQPAANQQKSQSDLKTTAAQGKRDLFIPSEMVKQDRERKVLKMIFDAKNNGRQISYNTITKRTGFTKEEINEIIEKYNKQKAEYKQKLAVENKKAIKTLQEAEKGEESLYSNPIQQKSKKAEVKKEEKTDIQPNISDIQYQLIEISLQRGKDYNYKVSLKNIAEFTHLDEKTVYKAIKSRANLLELWQEVKAPEVL